MTRILHSGSAAIMLAAVILFTLPTAAHAAKALVATCTGQGADFVLTELSELDAAIVAGLPQPSGDNAVLVIDEDGGNAHWSTQTRTAIDKECGGSGDVEIALFQPIQPRDGLWTISLSDHHMQGCSGMLAGAVKSGASSMLGSSDSRQLDFREPFHPHPLLAKAEDIHWEQTGLNTWHAVMAREKAEGKSMVITVTVDAEVMSPTHIVETQLFRIEMPPALAKIMGGSGDCRSTVHAQLNWVK